MRQILSSILFSLFACSILLCRNALAAPAMEVAAAIRQLSSRDAQSRLLAARELGWWHDPSGVQPLITALKDPVAKVRVEAGLALCRIGDSRAAAPLVALLSDRDNNVRWKIAEEIGHIGPAVIALLLPLLHSNDRLLRTCAVQVLGTIHDSRVVPLLLPLLHDADAMVQEAAISGLGKSRDPRTIAPLMLLLGEKDPDIWASAAFAFENFTDPKILPVLLPALKDHPGNDTFGEEYPLNILSGYGEAVVPPLVRMLDDTDVTVRRWATFQLATLAYPSATTALIHALQTDTDAQVRATAAHGLGRLATPVVVDPLINALQDSDITVREEALSALRFSKDARIVPLVVPFFDNIETANYATVSLLAPGGVDEVISALQTHDDGIRDRIIECIGSVAQSNKSETLRALVPALLALLETSQVTTRTLIVRTLGLIGDRTATPAIIIELRGGDPKLRAAAAEALGELSDARAVSPLIAAMADDEEQVRFSVLRSLGEVGDTRAIPKLVAMLQSQDAARTAAIIALGQIKDRQAVRENANAVPALISALRHDDQQTKIHAAITLAILHDLRAIDPLLASINDPDQYVRQEVVGALGHLRAVRAVPVLLQRYKQDAAIQGVVLHALTTIGDPRAIPLFTEELRKGAYKNAEIVKAFGQFKDVRVTETLLASLRRGNPEVRTAAAAALGRIGQARSVRYLIIALRDDDPEVRKSVAHALASITGQNFGEDYQQWLLWSMHGQQSKK